MRDDRQQGKTNWRDDLRYCRKDDETSEELLEEVEEYPVDPTVSCFL